MTVKKSFNLRRSYFLGVVGLFVAVPAQNSLQRPEASINNLNCLVSAGLKKSLEGELTAHSQNGPFHNAPPPKESIARESYVPWRLGRSKGFVSSPLGCQKGQFNPMAVGDARFHLKKQLDQRVRAAIAEVQSRAEGQTVLIHDLKSDEVSSHEFMQLARRMNYSPRCIDKFTANKGFGPLGKYVKEVLNTGGAPQGLIESEIVFEGACPGYIAMDEDQRKNLWVFLMMSMSNYESSCKETVFNEGPNGIASGLLQLHHESEDLYAKWDTDMNCDKGASMSARQSLKCGLTMLTRQVDQKKDFFSDQSHWQVLRYSKKPGTEAFQIRYAMSQIKECKADPVAMNLFGHWPLKERASTGVIVRKAPVLETPRVPASEIALLQPE